MTGAATFLHALLRDHPVDAPDDAEVLRSVGNGHQRFVRWLILRTVLAMLASAVLVAGVVQMQGLSAVVVGPEARLVIAPATGNEPLQVTADASQSSPASGSAIISVRFDFGDGTIIGPQAAPAAVHRYQDPGRYTITATVTDARGSSDLASGSVTVEPKGADSVRASVTASPSSGSAPLEVKVDASKSSPGTGNEIKSFRFDFGDKSAKKTQKLPVVSHVYSKPGTYRLTVKVADSSGDSDESSATITVNAPQALPRAGLKVRQLPCPAELTVEVDASSSSSAPGTGASLRDYRFDYGDGTIDGPQASPRATHRYGKSGRYPVTVTVTDSAERSDSARRTVEVQTRTSTKARLSVDPEQGLAPLGVTADASDSSDGDCASIESYQFNFGEGSPGDPQPSAQARHTYKEPGEYFVEVTVVDSDGNPRTARQVVIVTKPEEKPPVASLTVTNTSSTATARARADATGSFSSDGSPIVKYEFDFGDGTGPQSSGAAVLEHTYKEERAYTVTVKVTAANGRTAEGTQDVKVKRSVVE